MAPKRIDRKSNAHLQSLVGSLKQAARENEAPVWKAVAGRLEGGTKTQSVTVPAEGLREGDIAAALGEIQQDFESVSLGSYPYFNDDGTRGVNIVARSRDADALHEAEAALRRLVDAQGRSAS